MSYVSDAQYGIQSAIAVNSTITPLAGAATFTGSGELNQFPDVMASCYADVAGTLYFDFSVNGTDWRTFPASGFVVAAGVHEFHTVVKGPRYFRVRFVNGVSAQATFQLYIYYGVFRQPTASLNQVLNQNSDSIVVRSTDPLIDISSGRISGFATVNRFGHAPDGMQTTATDIWDRADSAATQQIWLAPTAARVHGVVSSSASDSAAGVGARTVKISGLVSWASKEVSETISMNGVTPVNTVNSYVIINKMHVLTSGSSGPNVGNISATAATDTTISAYISASYGSAAMAVFGWPSVQTFYVKNWKASLNKASGVAAHAVYSLLFNATPNTQAANFISVGVTGRQSNGESSAQETFDPYVKLDGPGIIKIQAVSSAADVDGSADFGGILVDV